MESEGDEIKPKQASKRDRTLSNLLGQALNCMACSGEGQECKDAYDVGSTQNCKSDETW